MAPPLDVMLVIISGHHLWTSRFRNDFSVGSSRWESWAGYGNQPLEDDADNGLRNFLHAFIGFNTAFAQHAMALLESDYNGFFLEFLL